MWSPRAQIEALLRDAGVFYERIPHRADYTAHAVAHDTHTPGRHVIKSVVLWVDGVLVLALLPATHSVDIGAFQEALRAAGVRLATEAEIAARFPGWEAGTLAPFGSLFDIPTYSALTLPDDALVTFVAGTHHDAIRMAYGDLRRLADAVPLAFARPEAQRVATIA